jgi:hypothetical protein
MGYFVLKLQLEQLCKNLMANWREEVDSEAQRFGWMVFVC